MTILVLSVLVAIFKKSLNVEKAYNNYMWKTDKEGAILTEPDHYLSDAMDAVRYGLEAQRPMVKVDDKLRPAPINTLVY